MWTGNRKKHWMGGLLTARFDLWFVVAKLLFNLLCPSLILLKMVTLFWMTPMIVDFLKMKTVFFSKRMSFFTFKLFTSHPLELAVEKLILNSTDINNVFFHTDGSARPWGPGAGISTAPSWCQPWSRCSTSLPWTSRTTQESGLWKCWGLGWGGGGDTLIVFHMWD